MDTNPSLTVDPGTLGWSRFPHAGILRVLNKDGKHQLWEGKRPAHLVNGVEQRGEEISVVSGACALQHSQQPFQPHSRVHMPVGQGLQASICLSGQGRSARLGPTPDYRGEADAQVQWKNEEGLVHSDNEPEGSVHPSPTKADSDGLGSCTFS